MNKVLHGILGGANKGLGEASKSCTRKEHESATNSIAKRGQGGTSSLFVCPLQGQGTASLVGLGATPQLFCVKSTQRKKSTRCRQRSVPASNFARPQTRPQAALPPRFRDEPKNIRGCIQQHPRDFDILWGWRVTRPAPSAHAFAAPVRESRTPPSRRPPPRRVSPAHQCPACRTRRC